MPVAGRDDADMGSSTAPGSSGSPRANGAPLTDAQIAGITELVNNAEIQQAELARSKSKDPGVLSFASMMISHHTQAKQRQAALGLSAEPSPLLQALSTNGQQTMSTLTAKTGTEFDRAYLKAQADQHQQVLDTIDSKLLPGAKNSQLRSQLQSMRSTVQNHLEAARAALKALDNQKSRQSSSQKSKSSNGSSTQQSGTGSATAP